MRALLVALVAFAACKSDATRRPRIRVSGSDSEPIDMQVTATQPDLTRTALVAAGKEWRWDSAHGPVHVWIPKGYDAKRAETIVYVHGYYIHVDDAWDQYELPQKFAASGIDAMFIACEAPAGLNEAVAWTQLAPLLADVEAHIGQSWPRRRIVAIGHSAAFRTLLGWLAEPSLDTVVLLDAAYGEIQQYINWIQGDDKRRLIDVGDDTREWTDKLHAELKDSYVLDAFPSVEDGMPRAAARARIVYIKSNLGHFPLVTNKTAVPLILRTLRAKRLLHEPLAEITATP
jgi:hypothetical protein